MAYRFEPTTPNVNFKKVEATSEAGQGVDIVDKQMFCGGQNKGSFRHRAGFVVESLTALNSNYKFQNQAICFRE